MENESYGIPVQLVLRLHRSEIRLILSTLEDRSAYYYVYKNNPERELAINDLIQKILKEIK